ncbi:Arm DNA-binding domain-containing protein [Paracoccus sp. (in: a-proteobacteria)]|uniref:Arm DNA-binding domain-containing protein n=1 Tax=Paracoccus sp. TaxID=267 RepID=UPI0034CF7098
MKQREKLTEKTVRAAEPRAKSWQMFDSEVLGLSVCVYASGSRSFMFDYRSAEDQRSDRALSGRTRGPSGAAQQGPNRTRPSHISGWATGLRPSSTSHAPLRTGGFRS